MFSSHFEIKNNQAVSTKQYLQKLLNFFVYVMYLYTFYFSQAMEEEVNQSMEAFLKVKKNKYHSWSLN